jgi:transcriptional regulator with XRE-family HTH domain/Zn-dependent peptidase ImmA (M78 family)
VIRNERQYRVTQSERAKLAFELQRTPGSDVPDWVAKASRDAIASQVVEMDEALADYDALRVGAVSSTTEVNDLADLPRALIRARIAGKLTQRDLAERLGLREQQVQRYEATDYAGANIARLVQVMVALGVSFGGELTLPVEAGGASTLRRTLIELGIGSKTVTRRFFGANAGAPAAAGWLNAAARAARVFQASVEDLMSGNVVAVANQGSFRASTAVNRDTVNGYARYAEYLAQRLALACTVEYRPLPDASQLRVELGDELVQRPLQALVRTCWQHGVPVLPLADPGEFYGACWHIDGRPVIALKHGMRSPDRWAFLLAHEMDHARNPDGEPVLEADLDVREWRARPSEQAADVYAAGLLLGETAEAMVRVAVDRAGGDVARLKSVVPDVAAAGRVSVGLLADHVAFRVASSNVNWWATANRLHPTDQDAWRISRSALFDYVDFSRLDTLDRDILIDGIGP